jgi:hypothetical protein
MRYFELRHCDAPAAPLDEQAPRPDHDAICINPADRTHSASNLVPGRRPRPEERIKSRRRIKSPRLPPSEMWATGSNMPVARGPFAATLHRIASLLGALHSRTRVPRRGLRGISQSAILQSRPISSNRLQRQSKRRRRKFRPQRVAAHLIALGRRKTPADALFLKRKKRASDAATPKPGASVGGAASGPLQC